MKRDRLGMLLIAFLLATPLHALDPKKSMSQFTHTSWSAKDGIPGPVRAIAQTADGYLWLGSEAGLYRFDGLRFVPWQPTTEERLPDSPVWSLLTARDGSLWVGFGSGGISQIRGDRVTNHPPGGGVPTGGILSIVEDGNGSIWAGGPYGLARFDGLKWHRIGPEAGYPAPGAQVLLVDHQGTVWVATDGSNFRLSKDPVERNTVLTLAPNKDRFSGTGEAVGMVWRMAEAPDGRVWIADTTRRRVRPISARTGRNAGISLDSESMCLTFDKEGALWVGLIEGGLRRIPDLTRLGTEPLDRFQAADGLTDELVYTTLEDREGDIWFGTAGGLDRFRENKVTPFSAREGVRPDQQIALTATPDGSIWFFSYARDAVRRFREGRVVTSRLPKYSPSDASRILSLYAGGSGHLLVGGSFKLAEENNGQFSFVHVAGLENGEAVEAISRDAGAASRASSSVAGETVLKHCQEACTLLGLSVCIDGCGSNEAVQLSRGRRRPPPSCLTSSATVCTGRTCDDFALHLDGSVFRHSNLPSLLEAPPRGRYPSPATWPPAARFLAKRGAEQ